MLNRSATQSPIMPVTDPYADDGASGRGRLQSLSHTLSSDSEGIQLHSMSPRSQSTRRSSSFTPAQVFARINSGFFDETSSDDSILLAKQAPPIPTSKVLQNFADVVARTIEPAVQRKRNEALRKNDEERHKHRVVLKALREWEKDLVFSQKHKFKYFLDKLRNPGRPQPGLPSVDGIVAMAKHYYPLRADVKVYVCDFGINKFAKQEVSLRDIFSYMHWKPEWADVRWIHAPVNNGLVQSSLEELFLIDRRDKHKNPKHLNFPYVQAETLSIRKHDDLKEMQDAYRILDEYSVKVPKLAAASDKLNHDPLRQIDEELLKDITWRASHWNIDPITHWNMALSDFQQPMSNSSPEFIDPSYTGHVTIDVDKQALSTCYFYRHAQLVKYAFRCFQSSFDGFLLTMCPNGGVDYIDKDLDRHLNQPSDTTLQDEDSSVVGLMLSLFSQTGSATWYRRNVDWFLIYILTEVMAKPHHWRQGCNAPSLLKAYQQVVQRLKEKRYAEFKRKESVKVVREYLACIDELSTMSMIWTRSRSLLDSLVSHADAADKDDSTPANEDGETALGRIAWSSGMVAENDISTTELLVDLQKSLTALFQVRSIEQNELAIVADSQNKAVLIFTGVTIVFLPLSFFTSYFGMNLQGISETSKTEAWFWQVCGTIGFLMMFILTVYVFRYRLIRQLRRGMALARA